jgi:hypothetical protein
VPVAFLGGTGRSDSLKCDFQRIRERDGRHVRGRRDRARWKSHDGRYQLD